MSTTADAPSRDLNAPDLYTNRELSWLEFNDRVLQLAADEQVPLLERVKFLAIYASNLDEFFMVRVAGVHDQVDAGIDARRPDGLSPVETLDAIVARVREQATRHARLWEEEVRPALAGEGIRIVSCAECDRAELERVDRRFEEQIFPVLTPLGVGPGRPFPYISNLSLSIAVWLRDPVTAIESFARVKVPREVLPRFVRIDTTTFVPLEDVIARHLDELFPGMEILHHDVFRVTRDADFTVSDEADDLLRAVEDELRRRRFGEVVRVELGHTVEDPLRSKLVHGLEVETMDVFDIEGMLDLSDLWDIHEIDGFANLRDDQFTAAVPQPFAAATGEKADVFAAIRDGDLLVHHPYESFAGTTERFIEQAVNDPEVLAIKTTVYRTSDDSALVPALIEAAEAGKQAVCLVEVTARFDERRNIQWARALEEVGAHVVHGLPGLKTHAKAVLVVRREGDGVRQYVHIGTGNYHSKTARIYEDFGLFTADAEIATDIADLFNSLTGYSRPRDMQKVLVAPAQMREGLLEQVRWTIEAAERGDRARIAMKMNSLVDRECIRALYEASQAGVQVDLNIRGICCLRPGIEGVSENVRVVSVVGRFLEHARVYSFHAGDETRWFIGSADLMPRNLDTRVEVLVPVESRALCDELADTLDRCFADDTFSWELDGTDWRRTQGGNRNAQAELMERAVRRAESVVDDGIPAP